MEVSVMYEEFTQNRVAQLRTQKGKTARDMSLTLGQNDAYINKIENKKSLPSLPGLFYICEYLGVTPHEFFDDENPNPEIIKAIVKDMKMLDDNALAHLAGVVKEMVKKKR
jgi:transcriptional regulator with XRE-family HTH domain